MPPLPLDGAAGPVCIGHRGAMGHAPENTLPAIELALDMGADWIEIDVQCVENELVVIHDDTLDRTTSGTGPVADMSLAGLRSLDAGSGAQIPLLREVLPLVDGRAGLNVELKGPGTGAVITEYLAAAGAPPAHSLSLSAFDHSELEAAAAAGSDIAQGALFGRWREEAPERARDLGAQTINLSVRTVTPERVERCLALGLGVLVYTVNETAAMAELLAMGVTGIFTNFPDRFPRAS